MIGKKVVTLVLEFMLSKEKEFGIDLKTYSAYRH